MNEDTRSTISRRSLLKGGAALAAAAAAPSALAAPTERIRAAVIGCRNRGHQVSHNFLESGQFDLVAMCDCDSAMIDRALHTLKGELENRPKPRIESDFRRILDAKDIDAVIVAAPDHWHAEMCVMALDAGKHVYQEKPASFCINDGKAMVAAQQRHPKQTVLVGTQQRSGRHFKEARDFVRSGGLGKVGFARAWITQDRGILAKVPDSDPPQTLDYNMWLGPAPKRPYNKNRVHYNWRFFHDYGTGDMGNWGAHWIDIVRWYLDLDLPRSATTNGGTYVVHDAKEWPDTQTVLFEYPGVSVVWELRNWTKYRVNDEGNGAEFGGDKGSLVITRHGWTFYPRDGAPVKHARSELEVAHASHFADCIRGQAKPVAPIEEGHKTAVCCHLGNIGVLLDRRLVLDPATLTFGDDAEANALLGRTYRKPWTLDT